MGLAPFRRLILLGVVCMAPTSFAQRVGGDAYFGEPVPGMNAHERAEFRTGLLQFARVWGRADGQRHRFNGRSCLACHSVPMPGGSGMTTNTFVFVSSDAQDGTGGHSLQRLERDDDDQTRVVDVHAGAKRRAPGLFGLGLLETVPVEEIQRRQEGPDHIVGKLPVVGSSIGRFGWKARVPSLRTFVKDALAVEIGVDPSVPSRSRDTESAAMAVDAITYFVRNLDPPPSRPRNTSTQTGEHLFGSVGCVQCHRATLHTASGVAFHPYTDLLLHDMGSGLADGISEGDAEPSEFRTPPLWGLSSSGPPYLHDGRAYSLDEAIEAHGGQAAPTINRWNALTATERGALIAFLRTL